MINTSVEWHSVRFLLPLPSHFSSSYLDSQPEERARQRHKKVSTIHGWVVKMRGTFFGSERTRRAGMREMKEARAIRRYKKEHPEHFRLRGGSGGGKSSGSSPVATVAAPNPVLSTVTTTPAAAIATVTVPSTRTRTRMGTGTSTATPILILTPIRTG